MACSRANFTFTIWKEEICWICITGYGVWNKMAFNFEMCVKSAVVLTQTSCLTEWSTSTLWCAELVFLGPNVQGCTLYVHHLVLGCVWNVMAHAQKPDFVFRRNGRVHLNRRGRQFSRLLAAEVCASAVVMLDTPCSEVVWKVLATHSIRQLPLHFPSCASPCAITFQLDSTFTWNRGWPAFETSFMSIMPLSLPNRHIC